MGADRNIFEVHIDPKTGTGSLVLRSRRVPEIPELASGITVEFRRRRTALFHLGVIGLIARWHCRSNNLESCFIGHEYDGEVRLLAHVPEREGYNRIEAPYRAILGMWAEYDGDRGIRLESRRSYSLRLQGRVLDADEVSPHLRDLCIGLLKGSGEASARNLKLRIDLQPCGVLPEEIRVCGLDELIAPDRARADTRRPANSARVSSVRPEQMSPYYTGLSLDTTGKRLVQQSQFLVTSTADGPQQVRLRAGPYEYEGVVEFRETVLLFLLEGVKHSERLTMIMDRPLCGDMSQLRGVFCAINHKRRPVAGKIVLREQESPAETDAIPLSECNPDLLDFLQSSDGGLLLA